MAALWFKSHLFLLFFCSFISPSHLLLHSVTLPLCLGTIFSSPLLPLCLSSLQEVLELAFSVLYESDEYLNFIAPDKHEVSPTAAAPRLLTVSDRMNMCDRTKRGYSLYKYSVYASVGVRYVVEIITAAYFSGSFNTYTVDLMCVH